jgi:uncharacterized Zn finger protein (UPF0148 family)
MSIIKRLWEDGWIHCRECRDLFKPTNGMTTCPPCVHLRVAEDNPRETVDDQLIEC